MKQLFALLVVAGLLWAVPALASVQGRDIEYRAADGTVLKGYLAIAADLAGQRPGVLVVHEWWGRGAGDGAFRP
jgi:hypothetical protein